MAARKTTAKKAEAPPSRLRRAPSTNQWFTNLENIERLRGILEDPVFIAASNLLLNASRLNTGNLFKVPALIPLKAAQVAGYNDFYNDLVSLAKAPETFNPTLPDEWSHIGSEEEHEA
jgi:hypothetical protein